MLSFDVDAQADGEATQLRVAASDGVQHDYRIGGGDPEHYAAFYAALARDFGIRDPHDLAECSPPRPIRAGSR